MKVLALANTSNILPHIWNASFSGEIEKTESATPIHNDSKTGEMKNL
jgi:hypothetical protein